MKARIIVMAKIQSTLLAYPILLSFFFTWISPASACRYTVRELGFSDLLSPPYRLYVYPNAKLSQKQKEQLVGIYRAALVGSNIEAASVDERLQPGKGLCSSALPSDSSYACLVSPDSLINPLILKRWNESIFTFVSRVVRDVSTSPVRKMILADILSSHAVILLFAGADRATTAVNRQVIGRVVQQIDPVLGLMPKPTAKPPRLIEIPFAQRQQERVLIWSLGMAENLTDPAVVILYGRGRQMGPVLHGSKISAEAIMTLLSLVGADCECDLDRAYLQGAMIPLVWSEKTRSLVARTLDFDPENPLVKMEMYRIARINMTVEGVERSPAQAGAKLTLPMKKPLHQDQAIHASDAKSNAMKLYLMVCLLITIGVLILVSVLFILFYRKRRSRS